MSGMEVLQEVEEHLRTLSVEARKAKQLSGVKEAAERGIVRLRGLKEAYSAHLRQSREAEARGEPRPGPFSFQAPELLQPFLLACNHSDAGPRLTLLALGAMQHLMNRDALHPSDGPNVMRVLAIQAQAAQTEVQLRVLQSCLLLVSSPSTNPTEDLLSQALLVCFALSEAKDGTVRNAAAATVRQIISMVFDRVEPRPEPASELSGASRCAYLVFQDLCLLSRGEQGEWLKRTSVPPTMGLELVDQILSQQTALFRADSIFAALVTRQVCPLVLRILRDPSAPFPSLVRAMRTVNTLFREFGDVIAADCAEVPTGGLALPCRALP